jgi:CRISPR-associated endonuclease/helicase Cas3
MTATFSRELLQGLARYLDAIVVPESQAALEQMQGLASQQKERHYHVVAEPLTAEAVWDHHAKQRGRTLVVCNVVRRAQRLYETLRELAASSDTRVRLLHSRFLRQDRARTENEVRSAYARQAPKDGDIITVATMLIEVGLDITCDSMHTELAPANAIVQRAGRCARYQGERGDVFVYPTALGPDGTEDLVERHLPYKAQGAEVAATPAALAALEGRAAGYTDEQNMVSSVHGARDASLVRGLTAGREQHRRLMNAAMRGDVSSAAGVDPRNYQ